MYIQWLLADVARMELLVRKQAPNFLVQSSESCEVFLAIICLAA